MNETSRVGSGSATSARRIGCGPRSAEKVDELEGAPPQAASAPPEPTFDLIAHIARAKTFSENTFGPGIRTAGVVDHIRKELREVEADPTDLEEWVDVWMLALDGAWRAGYTAEQIVAQIDAKQTKNENRKWPDWRTVSRDRAIEHGRTGEGASPAAGGPLTLTLTPEPVAWRYRYHAAAEWKLAYGVGRSVGDRRASRKSLSTLIPSVRILDRRSPIAPQVLAPLALPRVSPTTSPKLD